LFNCVMSHQQRKRGVKIPSKPKGRNYCGTKSNN
jgi:hypothetical protein